MKLKLGKMTSKELAKWFDRSYNTYKNKIDYYLDILSEYCDFEKIYGGVNIKEIYIEEYDKEIRPKAKRVYLKEVERTCGLMTLSGLSRRSVAEGQFENSRQGYYLFRKVGYCLFGDPNGLSEEKGSVGSRQYVWAVKLDDLDNYRYMTDEEQELFNNIIREAYGKTDPEKIKQEALWRESLLKKEITAEQYSEKVDSLYNVSFFECLQQFKNKIGYWVVRCTQHTIDSTETEDFTQSGDESQS